MAHPYHHALSSAKKWGGGPEEYLLLHQYIDQSKATEADFRHRAALHHSLVYICSNSILDPSSQSPQPHRSCSIHRGTTCDTRSGPDSNTFRLTRASAGTLDGPNAASASRGRSLRACPCLRRILTMFATYLRLHLSVDASWRAVVRAAASRLAPHSRRDSKRQARRDFYEQCSNITQSSDLVRVYRL